MIAQIIKCDGCGVVKGESNHWFSIEPVPNPGGGLTLIPKVYTASTFHHYCSDQCVIKAVQQWLSAQQEGSAAKV